MPCPTAYNTATAMDQGIDLPHRCSIRIRGFDYRQRGAYFVTIVAHRKQFLFGEVNFGAMKLSLLGDVANECWMEIPHHFPNIELPGHIVMPNHIHGIIVIRGAGIREKEILPESFGKPVPESLPTILCSFKAAVTLRARRNLHPPGLPVWQRGYYEHVIRNEDEFREIVKYIRENPRRWEFDSENPFGVRSEEWNF